MKINITEIFCEILSGLILVLLLLPIQSLITPNRFEELETLVIKNLSIPNVTLIIIVSYFLGLITDSIGLFFGEWFLDKLANRVSPSNNRRKFYNNVSAHILAYRDTQWAYYSLYRNLFILFFIHGILWVIYLAIHEDVLILLITILTTIFIEIALLKTMKTLSALYCEITDAIEDGS